jgi:hypothetical protein
MKRRTLSLIISGLLGVIAILSGIYLMAASVTNYIAESKKTDWIVTEARITDVSSRVKMLMYGKVSQENYVELTAASAIPNKEIKSPQILRY